MQAIVWAPVLIFMTLLVGFAVVEHLRTRERKRNSRADFRRMQSPYARPRHRTGPSTARAVSARPRHIEARRRFAR